MAPGSSINDEETCYLTTLCPPTSDGELQRQALLAHMGICHPCAMIRRESLDSIGGYDPEASPAEDFNLYLRLGEIGQLANLHEPVLRYRLHSHSISEQKSSEQRVAAMQDL